MSIRVVLIPFITLLTATLSGIMTNPFSPWYLALNMPSFIPSGGMISTAWAIIYITATTSAFFIFSRRLDRRQRKIFIALFLANACLNIAWSWLFFGFHMLGASVIDAILLLATIIATMLFARRVSTNGALLLIPYATWMCFVTYLNFTIWTMNR